MYSELSLAGKVAIITGGSRGIGREIAMVLSEGGANVVLVSRTATELEKTARKIRRHGGNVIALRTDVTDSSQVDAMVATAVEEYGRIDILVNNAAQYQKQPLIPLPGKSFQPPITPEHIDSAISDNQWRNMVETNLSSVFYCCRAVGEKMIAQRSGKVINISSNSAVQGAPLMSAYNSTKAAVNMLTRVLALEWAPYNISVNAIGPGVFHTAMPDFSWSDPDQKKQRLERIPMNREGNLRDIGLLAAFLSSSAADYITGQIVHVDGGLTAR